MDRTGALVVRQAECRRLREASPAAAIARLKNAELPFGSGYTTGGSNAGRSGADNQNVEIGLGS
jgi:hypothetical protein